MSPLREAESIGAVRKALEPFYAPDARENQYLWDMVSVKKVRWDDVASARLSGKEECILVFDPNQWNMPARLAVAKIAGCDEAPVAYRCVQQEVKSLFSQPWISNADFYLLTVDGHFVGMRTHEDTGSNTGMWIPAENEAG